MHTLTSFTTGMLATLASAILLQPAAAQTAPLQEHWEYVNVASGPRDNRTPIEVVVWSDFVVLPQGTPWLRLHYENATLGQGSYLRIASVLDGDVMTMHNEHLGQWSYTSCYFNGNAVLVELVAGPNTVGNLVEITKVAAGDIHPASTQPETICGSTDNRVPSSDARTARINPIGCTGWIIDSPSTGVNKVHLSAGHCAATGNVLQFEVPSSNANCSLVHPPASKQFAIDTVTDLWANSGVGNNWWAFRCFPNPTTGKTTFEEQNAAWTLSPVIPANGTLLRNYGYGIDGSNFINAPAGGSCSCFSSGTSGARNQTQQTHTGPLTSVSGDEINYDIDTCNGSSGSPISDNATGLAIGIDTHGGCTSTFPFAGSNSGTSILNSELQAAIVTVGIDVLYDAGPIITDPNGGYGGAAVSVVASPLTTFGFFAMSNNGTSVADDFATNGIWSVNAIELYCFADNYFFLYPVPPTITGVFLEIYNGNPSAGGVPIAGSPGFATNLVGAAGYGVSNTFADVNRVASSSLTYPYRRIQKVVVTLPAALSLNSASIAGGRYYLRYAFTGWSNGVLVPPITIAGSPATGSGALQYSAGAWSPLASNGYPQGVPFRLLGSSGSPAAQVTNLGGGCTAATLDVRGALHVGGVVHVEMSGTAPSATPVILLGVADPAFSFLPACSCVQHASLEVVHVGSAYTWQVPMVPSAVGFECYTQGVQVEVPGSTLPCDVGADFWFGLTDGYKIRFW